MQLNAASEEHMEQKRFAFYFSLIVLVQLLAVMPLAGQEMNMAAMENSVGFLSSGTSVQPKATSESEPMIHKTFGNWTLMFHANAFLVDTQQSGPRGKDKFYS